MAINKKLAQLTVKLQKQYGVAVASTAADMTDREIITHSTGSLMLDLALGAGGRAGMPEGRLVEVYGPESAGKTTTVMLMIAARQKEEDMKEVDDPSYEKKACLFVDAEHAFDMKLAEEYGINLEELIYVNPEIGEQAMDVLDAYIRTGAIGLAVVDSVPAIVPASIEKASFEQQHMATLARFMSGVCQKLSGPAYNNKCTLIFINQIREKVGVLYGNPETTPGGRALKYYASIRLTVRAGEKIKDGTDIVGHQMKIKVVKNKIAVPFKEATVNLIYGEGVDKADELFQISLKAGLIKQGGAWFSYLNDDGEVRKFDGELIRYQGREKVIEAIRKYPLFYGELEDLIRGVEVEADSMTPEEIEAYNLSIKEAEESASQAAEKAHTKNKKKLEEKLAKEEK